MVDNIKLDTLILQERLLGTAYDLINAGSFPGHYATNITEVQAYLKAIHGQVKLEREKLQVPVEVPKVDPEVILEPEVIK